jgi:SOS-response transcriptional repressor LexA
MSKVAQVLAGYAFDGLVFQRASVNAKTLEVINKETRQALGNAPSLLLWYTRREFTNAVATLQSRGQMPKDTNLVSVAPTAELMAYLNEHGSIRMTYDHILHMLTAGIERARGSKFTDAEVKAYESEAASMVQELEDAIAPAVPLRKTA